MTTKREQLSSSLKAKAAAKIEQAAKERAKREEQAQKEAALAEAARVKRELGRLDPDDLSALAISVRDQSVPLSVRQVAMRLITQRVTALGESLARERS